MNKPACYPRDQQAVIDLQLNSVLQLLSFLCKHAV